MKKIAATKDLQDEPPSHTEEVLSKAQVITWSCVLTWEAAFITLGNLFTIITFTVIYQEASAEEKFISCYKYGFY